MKLVRMVLFSSVVTRDAISLMFSIIIILMYYYVLLLLLMLLLLNALLCMCMEPSSFLIGVMDLFHGYNPN